MVLPLQRHGRVGNLTARKNVIFIQGMPIWRETLSICGRNRRLAYSTFIQSLFQLVLYGRHEKANQTNLFLSISSAGELYAV